LCGALITSPVHWIYTAGTLGADSKLILAPTFATQLVLALQNVKTVPVDGGATIRNIVKLTFYIVNWDRGTMLEDFNREVTAWLTDAEGLCKPPRTLVGVKNLTVPEFWMGIDCVAAVSA
jgi:enamine deaminase RidA (YjgF/YER057c/UK114 family)